MADLDGLFRDPREFLKHNLLIMMGSMPVSEGMYGWELENTEELGVAATRESKFFWKGRYPIKVWNVRVAPGTRPGFPAYWLPYQPNSRQKASARADAPLLLTAQMTGCSFGAVRQPDGSLDAYHVNYQTEEGGLDEARMAREISFCPNKLDQRRYRENARGKAVVGPMRQAVMGATIVGVNGPKKGWKLYAQQWENTDGAKYVYHALLDI